ncbi:dTDP-4-dehydrorhamnose 3,5-epimerase [Candidatus Brocadiaceae bacterium S225]|uniref:dTDP-4-dehydrorhamnose 3,5-epimerase n=1 Tax=Candidatus Scalindua brodae TaxID=237368 RepID=A0A0B0EN56_9BACT|nr:MAG: strongly sinmilar to dTDP-4-deoxyrhamnose 3,5 epimerase [Candidatus Scalindua brodae]TWU31472.1 dTDP-4-dehydrorhamnose 3,5-epimerase [Candidatus Brocadiaceae bacterium S225]
MMLPLAYVEALLELGNGSDKSRRQIFVPEGFAHGFCVFSETADVLYKTTDLYNPNDEYGCLCNLTIALVLPL